jgi:hypothetical protein
MGGDELRWPSFLPVLFKRYSTGLHFDYFFSASITSCLILIVAKGFGSPTCFTLSAGLGLGLLLWQAVKVHDRFIFARGLLALGLAIFYWPTVHLWGYWAFATSAIPVTKRNWLSTFSPAFLALWVIQCTEVGSWSAIPSWGIPTFLMCCLGFRFVPRWSRFVLVALCVVAALVDITYIYRPHEIEIGQAMNVAQGYSPGPTLAKLLGGSPVQGEVKGDIGITSLFFNQGPNRAIRQIVLGEHGQKPTPEQPVWAGGDLQQSEPWAGNQLFGNQYVLAAIAEDGQWVSNLGGGLERTGRLILASSNHTGGSGTEPLIIAQGKVIYVQDSDPFCDRLSAYQPSALREIVVGQGYLRIINVVLAVLSLLASGPLSMAALGAGVVAFFLWYCHLQPGDVRLCGVVGWPHEPSRISGVLRSLADAGMVMTRGSSDCRLLVVDEGRSAKAAPAEHLVLAAPGASVSSGQATIRVDDLPLGDVDGIIDARRLIVNGVIVGAVYKEGGRTIIGTGSPARQDWAKWLR